MLNKWSLRDSGYPVAPSDRAAVQRMVQYEMEIAGSLQAIADSHTDDGFTNAIIAMCGHQDAAVFVGRVEAFRAAQVASTASTLPGYSAEQRADIAAFIQSMAEVMISIPARCEQAKARLAQASAQEQLAEVHHQTNVNRALIVAGVLVAATAIVAAGAAQGFAEAHRPVYTSPDYRCASTGGFSGNQPVFDCTSY
jgi:hypothetical protein